MLQNNLINLPWQPTDPPFQITFAPLSLVEVKMINYTKKNQHPQYQMHVIYAYLFYNYCNKTAFLL
jgi:hypothetical protein